MNSMKTTTFRSAILQVAGLIFLTLTIGATALSVRAVAQDPGAPPPGQGGPRGRGMRGHQVEFLTQQLNLTPDQVTQVKAIDADTWKQAQAMRDDTSIAGPDKRSKMMEIHKASQDKIRALLTPDQQTKFDALQTQMRQRRENHGGGNQAAPPTPQL